MIKTLTIGIPVYNEELNIKALIKSLLVQKQIGFKIERIIISSDGSTDSTVKIVNSVRTKKIMIDVLENKTRRGIARGLNQIISKTKSDMLVTLDGDIHIKDKDFIFNLVTPIIEDKADLTSSAICELPQRSRIAKTLYVSMRLKNNLFKSFGRGNNLYLCHGLARAYSKKMYKKLRFPVSVGNDMYSYLFCISNNLIFKFAHNALAYYRLPESIEDHRKQSLRYFVSAGEQATYFDAKFVDSQTRIPKIAIFKGALLSIPILVLNPLSVFRYVLLQNAIKGESKTHEESQTWEVALSSKNI